MATTCQVDFYVLKDEAQIPEILACHLALKAWEQGFRIMVLTQDAAGAARLDGLMWHHPQGRFLPHAQQPDAASAPVVISTPEQLNQEACGLLINLTQDAVAEPERFARLLEIVPADPANRSISRDKFRAYRSRGLEPSSHTINPG